MPDSRIDDLDAANTIREADLFVLQQDGTAKKLTGFTLIHDLAQELDGHGGISTITEGATTGGKTYFTITFTDGTTSQFYSQQGVQGEKGNPLYYSSQDFGSGTTFSATKSNISPASPAVAVGCFVVFRDGIMAKVTSSSSTTVTCTKLTSFKGVGGVDSVNGQTGAVELDASDVGARPAGTPIGTSDISAGAITSSKTIVVPITPAEDWGVLSNTYYLNITDEWITSDCDYIVDCVPGANAGTWDDILRRMEDYTKLFYFEIGSSSYLGEGTVRLHCSEPFTEEQRISVMKIKR